MIPRNLDPKSNVDSLVPNATWKNPTISHLCLFGSIAYMHVPDQERSKLDNHSEKYVFIGMIQALRVIKQLGCGIWWRMHMELEHPKRRKISFFFHLFNEDE